MESFFAFVFTTVASSASHSGYFFPNSLGFFSYSIYRGKNEEKSVCAQSMAFVKNEKGNDEVDFELRERIVITEKKVERKRKGE